MTTAPGARRRRLRPTRVAAVALLLVPILEIMVMVAVGQAIGGWWTFLLVIATSALGAWIVTREGGRAWRALGQALREGRMPARELADGIVVLVGGTLLLIPGFITDVAGLLLVLPFTRPIARALLASVIGRHLLAQVEVFGATTVTDRPTWEQQETPHGPQRSESSTEVVEGEIIDED
ncbi:UPF0716 protein FxsA [Humibacillus xanthopallidus]|uniref:UPF0716 protein FxsA n=1 Tax=Humibacillus xanthopallidus TaxID=412689 RepID=A0A543PV08_9MICO|nr:FxsA family protein [Humibacillus xanthopallidus]TQN47914.1 UPF0716 protein FxsA [Humibacillus xanthopallidus]